MSNTIKSPGQITEQTRYIFFITPYTKNRFNESKDSTFSRHIVTKTILFIGQNVITH